MKFIFIYIAFTNILLFTLMSIDKQRAKLNQWRISEKTLFILALIGGSIEVYLECILSDIKQNT